MTTVKITSEVADGLADMISQYIDEFFDPEDHESQVDADAVKAALIKMLGKPSGTSFTVEIK